MGVHGLTLQLIMLNVYVIISMQGRIQTFAREGANIKSLRAKILGHAHKTAVNEHNGWQLGQFSTFLTLFYYQFQVKSKAQGERGATAHFCIKKYGI